VEPHRETVGPRASEPADGNNGAFILRIRGVDLCCIASDGMGWDHVSVTVLGQRRVATYDELEAVRGAFFRDDECVLMYSVPRREHINVHEFCLHLWRPQVDAIPRPPAFMV
jgi:hypothetical protein